MDLPTPFLRYRQIYLQPPRFCAGYSQRCKTQKQQTNVGGWVLRNGMGQLRETGSTLAAPPATSRATNPRQHRPKDLSKTRRDIHLIISSIVKTPDLRTSWTSQRNSPKISATFSKEPTLLCTSSSWVWVAPSTILTLWSSEAFQGTGSWFSELRSLPPSSMCTLWTSLLILSIPDVPFPVLLSTYQLSSRAGFRPSLQPSWSPLIFLSFSRWRSFTVLGTKVALFLINVGSDFHCLRSFFFPLLFIVPKCTTFNPTKSPHTVGPGGTCINKIINRADNWTHPILRQTVLLHYGK